VAKLTFLALYSPAAWGLAMAVKEKESIIDYMKATLHEWKLILQRVEKPDKIEYIQAAKVIWLAILLVGSVAYVIHFVATSLLTG